MSRKPRVLSQAAATILRRFLGSPEDELYGFEIIRETGIPSSTLYPALRLLAEDRLYLTARWEEIDPVAAGRPPRRLYRLEGAAAPAVRAALAERAEHEGRRPSPSSGLTPRTAKA